MGFEYEPCDALNTPIECFLFDSEKENFPILPHWHYFMEVIIMRQGEALMTADGEEYLLKKGDMILFHPKTVHGITGVGSKKPVYDVMKFDINCLKFSSAYAPKFRSVFRIAQRKNMFIYFAAEKAEIFHASDIFKECITEMKEQKYGFELDIKANIYRLLIGIIREWSQQGFYAGSEAFSEDDKYDIYNITEFIDSNMGSDVKVSDIAQQCGMSYSYFSKSFLRVYGKTCKEYIEHMRIFKVEEFLLFTNFDLNYISQETGFSDCSHMIKSFRKYKNITPKQFRLRRLNGEFDELNSNFLKNS